MNSRERPAMIFSPGLLLLSFLLAVTSLAPVRAFQFNPVNGPGISSIAHGSSSKSDVVLHPSRRFSRISSVVKSQQTEAPSPVESGDHLASETSSSIEEPKAGAHAEAARLREQADRIRLEAEQLDSALTLRKIETLERKLKNNSWLAKNPDDVDSLKQQLESLNDKLFAQEPILAKSPGLEDATKDTSRTSDQLTKSPFQKSERTLSSSSPKPSDATKRLEGNPLAGYDEADLALYVPVVDAIEKQMPNATLDKKLEAFRAAPELQLHFQQKIRKMFMSPLEDMQKLENLKQDYLASSSSVEKKQIKREMEQVEKAVNDDSPFIYSDSVVYKDLPPLTEEEIQQRLEAVGELNPILQALYKKRCGVNETGDLRLAIELDHFEPQINLLEQVRDVEPITDELRHEIRIGLLSLPSSVRNHFAKSLGLDSGEDITAMIEALTISRQEEWMTIQQVVQTAGKAADSGGSMVTASVDLPEYADIEFVDRSRYIQEFIPALAKLEIIHPPMEDVELLLKEVLDRRIYKVTSKPERVIGGYYIYGISESPNNDEFVAKLQKRLQKSSLKNKIDLFYIQDPTPPTDEEYEAGEIDRPVLVVTAKNRELMYSPSAPLTKILVSLLGLFSIVLFSLATTEMQPSMRDQLEAAAAGDVSIDISPVLISATLVGVSILATQLIHETAHRFVAWKDKFEIGFPTIVPSIQIGFQGAITPFKSPPPSNKSLFDFSIAGPLAGLIVSLGLLVGGLDITTSMDLAEANQLPALPIFLLKSSALGGGLVEFFVGKGSVMSSSSESVLPLHPFAIAGFVGILSNSLSLLPIGHTDGGRIATTMFGRRGASLVKTLTALILCSMGIFGFDDPRLFLTYVLFVQIWQRELEAPTLNEADDLDFPRGLVGIGTAIIVFLALLPMI